MRIIRSPHLDGITNMAIDQAIMESVGDGVVPPTLRFYGWEPACLSLGYAQRARDVNWDGIGAKGWNVVRRPTGGRAILHTDELTYSISFPQDHPIVQGDIVTSYRRLSEGLKYGLELLGVDSQTAPYQKGALQSPVCFETPSAYEITINGKKLIGSAQVRRQKAVLQHGSVPLTGDIARICDALQYPDTERREAAKIEVRKRATTIETALGHQISWQTLANALQQGFTETFGFEFIQGDLTPQESLRVETLRNEVYATEAWTQKRL